VTYTGDGNDARSIAHNLGSAPGAIFVKCTSAASDWSVYHKDLSGNTVVFTLLNSTAANSPANVSPFSGATYSGYMDFATSSAFRVRLVDPVSGFAVTGQNVNQTGQTYVAYVFASNAGGFGLTGTDNVISCGSYTGNGSATGPVINLGYEPQWVLIKNTTSAGFNWILFDNMRGMPVDSNDNYLFPNTSAAENSFKLLSTQATGFQLNGTLTITNNSGDSYIYIAIRRGPMKVPTDATKVFAPNARTATGANANITGIGFPPDFLTSFDRTGNSGVNAFFDRLRGPNNFMSSASTDGEASGTGGSPTVTSFNMDGISVGPDTSYAAINFSTRPYVNHYFRRAPSFFDEVCYIGTGVAQNISHNLTVAPELIIVKSRSNTISWAVQVPSLGAVNGLNLNTTAALFGNPNFWDSTAPTASVFTVGGSTLTGNTGLTYVAYLFATCPGVSKVGSYTGNGTTQAIACGFTGGARFVLIKRTDSTGNWMVVDTARGLVSAGDPTLYLNSTAAEVTGVDWLDPDSSGFIVNQEGTMNANVSSATYIFLAIA
jgi:hypothetical protein